MCNHENNRNDSWEPCLIPGGPLSDFEQAINVGELEYFNLPKNNFNPIDSNSLPLVRSDIKIQAENKLKTKLTTSNSKTNRPENIDKISHTSEFFIKESTTSTPIHTTTPGSIASTPTWSFPTEGKRKHLNKHSFLTDQTSSVYFDPSLRECFRTFTIGFKLFSDTSADTNNFLVFYFLKFTNLNRDKDLRNNILLLVILISTIYLSALIEWKVIIMSIFKPLSYNF